MNVIPNGVMFPSDDLESFARPALFEYNAGVVLLLRVLVRVFSGIFRPLSRRRRPGEPIECLLVGYGGANNTGAEARTAEAIRQMLAADERLRITLTSLDRRQTLRYINEAERLRVAQIHPVFLISILRLVLHSDLVVLIEGSCFKENFSSALLWFFLYAAGLAQRLGKPTVAYGVDAGALSPANRRWARDVAERMDLLMVRTGSARGLLRSMGVFREIVVTADTAFTLVPENEAWAETVLLGQGIDLSRPIVGIAFEEFFWWPVVPRPLAALFGVREDRYKSVYYHSWGRDGRARSSAMKEQVARYADWAAKAYGVQIVLIAMERLDIGPCRDLQGMISAHTVLVDADHANAAQVAAILRRLDWLVTCRYHALVLAMGGRVPTIGLAHDERIATIMDELGLLQEAFVSFDDGDVLELLEEKTRWLREHSSSVRRRIESSLPGYLTRMAENGRRFGELLASRFPAGPPVTEQKATEQFG